MNTLNDSIFEDILDTFHLKDFDIISVFPYGSQVYGTNSEKSDYDFIAVFKDGRISDDFALEKKKYNIHTYNYSTFIKLIEKHKISALECIFLPEDKILCNRQKYQFKLDLKILRSSLSEKASHSWVKAKKKFEVEKDKNIYIAKKSLFHSFRIIDFGKQIAKNGKIIDYSSMNDLWFEIYNNSSEEWKDYFELYKTKHNENLTEFRELAPK
jgi:predicted nucleotidyltransferase